jgi:inhibitor of KinA
MFNNRNHLPNFLITGEKSIRFSFGNEIKKETFEKVCSFHLFIEQQWEFLLQEIVPSYHTVTVYLRGNVTFEKIDIKNLLDMWCESYQKVEYMSTRLLSIPVCYESPFCEDLYRISEYTGLAANEIIQMHAKTIYTVYMIGFLPGFPYLGELPEVLNVPRLDKPRLNVPKGTVGIGGSQTGIYPVSSPGGWNILGRTPIEIYNPMRSEPFLLQAGDQLKFFPISYDDYLDYEKKISKNALDMHLLVSEVENREN